MLTVLLMLPLFGFATVYHPHTAPPRRPTQAPARPPLGPPTLHRSASHSKCWRRMSALEAELSLFFQPTLPPALLFWNGVEVILMKETSNKQRLTWIFRWINIYIWAFTGERTLTSRRSHSKTLCNRQGRLGWVFFFRAIILCPCFSNGSATSSTSTPPPICVLKRPSFNHHSSSIHCLTSRTKLASCGVYTTARSK